MSSYSHASQHRGGGGMSTATLLAAKVAVASAALAAAASLLARVAVPHFVSLAGAVFPRAWAVARFWLAPPYLFVTVHLIILVIWKLSDKHYFQAQPHHHNKDPWPVVANTPAVVAVEEEVFGAPAAVKAKEKFSPDSAGGGDGDSCVTTESDEDTYSSAPSHYFVDDEARSNIVPVPQERRAVPEREELSLPPPSQSVDCGEGDDDLDATWNAIMQKTRSAQEPPPRARDPSVGAEEMNRRFDDFIKKKRNSFGWQ